MAASYFSGDIGQRQRAIDRQTLLRRMPTEQLELRTDDPLLREIGDELVAEEMRIDPLGNPCRQRVLLDDLPEAPRRVRLVAIRLEEIGRACVLLAFQILGKFAPKARRKEHIAILVPFALRDADLAGLQIDIA